MTTQERDDLAERLKESGVVLESCGVGCLMVGYLCGLMGMRRYRSAKKARRYADKSLDRLDENYTKILKTEGTLPVWEKYPEMKKSGGFPGYFRGLKDGHWAHGAWDGAWHNVVLGHGPYEPIFYLGVDLGIAAWLEGKEHDRKF